MEFIKFFKSKTFIVHAILTLVVSFLVVLAVESFLHGYTNQEQRIEVPNLIGLTEGEAEVILEDVRLRFEVLKAGNFNPNIPPKGVIDQHPAPGKIVKEKRKVFITLNLEEYASASIPVFYGKTKKEIERVVINSGFTIGHYEKVDDIGTVVRGLKHKGKTITEGDKLPKMSVIDVVIGNGKLK